MKIVTFFRKVIYTRKLDVYESIQMTNFLKKFIIRIMNLSGFYQCIYGQIMDSILQTHYFLSKK